MAEINLGGMCDFSGFSSDRQPHYLAGHLQVFSILVIFILALIVMVCTFITLQH